MSRFHRMNRGPKESRVEMYYAVLDRDKGVCFLCKKDNESLLRFLRSLNTGERRRLASRHKITFVRLKQALTGEFGRLWDFDHIKPLGDGGEFGKDNIRTVCIECHLYITKIYNFTSKGIPIPQYIWNWSRRFSRKLRKQIFP